MDAMQPVDRLANDLLVGADAIAEYLGLETRTVYYWASNDRLPTFNIGAKLCLRKSTMTAWIASRERCTAELGPLRDRH